MPYIHTSPKYQPRRNAPPRHWASFAEMPATGITLREAAEHLGPGFAYQTLWQWCRTGALSHYLQAEGLWEPGMIIRSGRLWRLNRRCLMILAQHTLPSLKDYRARMDQAPQAPAMLTQPLDLLPTASAAGAVPAASRTSPRTGPRQPSRPNNPSRQLDQILDRAEALCRARQLPYDRFSLDLDLAATQALMPLRLADLLAAPDAEFLHEIQGITRCLNRATGRFTHHFVPRYADFPS